MSASRSKKDLVKKKDVVANATTFGKVADQLQAKILLPGDAKPALKVAFHTLRAQLSTTEGIVHATEMRDGSPSDANISLGDLAGKQDTFLQRMEDQVKAAIGHLSQEQPEVDRVIELLRETVEISESYVDELTDEEMEEGNRGDDE